jgi:hypothetical protein
MQYYYHVSVTSSAVPLITRTKMTITGDSNVDLHQRDTLCGRISQSCSTLSSASRSSWHLRSPGLLTTASHGEQQSWADLPRSVGARW